MCLLKVSQQAAQRVAVRPHGVEAATALLRQVLCQELFQVTSDVGFGVLHDRPPFRYGSPCASLRFMHCSNKAGTPLRYQ